VTGKSHAVPWPGDWIKKAACRGEHPGVFFPAKNKSVEAARAICRTCFVQQDCLQYANATATRFGVWGGTSQRQRDRMKRNTRQIALANTQPRINGRFASRGAA
jgi:WhiB family redox-sensing transcriptional regulator